MLLFVIVTVIVTYLLLALVFSMQQFAVNKQKTYLHLLNK